MHGFPRTRYQFVTASASDCPIMGMMLRWHKQGLFIREAGHVCTHAESPLPRRETKYAYSYNTELLKAMALLKAYSSPRHHRMRMHNAQLLTTRPFFPPYSVRPTSSLRLLNAGTFPLFFPHLSSSNAPLYINLLLHPSLDIKLREVLLHL